MAGGVDTHDGCLWLEEPILITDRLIHRITWLPYIGENLAMMFGEKVASKPSQRP